MKKVIKALKAERRRLAHQDGLRNVIEAGRITRAIALIRMVRPAPKSEVYK